MSNNVNCPYCKKNRPHGHKGCNEVGLRTILIKKKENKWRNIQNEAQNRNKEN